MAKKRGLKAEIRKQLRKASREAVESCMRDLVPHFVRKRWIAQSNEYRLRSTVKIDSQTVTNPPTFNSRDLSEYITASCALHAVDGWSFLGRAFSSLVHGDSDSARFFAYYAELRAAMSILASTGTGIFLSKHAIIDKARQCELVTGGQTHRATWEYLSYWAKRRGAKTLLEDVIRPGDKKLSEWLRQSPMGGVTPRLLAKRWLKMWGIDLRRMSIDRDARNESSYRPTQFQRPVALSGADTAAFITSFWTFFEPWPPNFGAADRYLLRTLLHATFYAVHNTPVQNAMPAFRAQVETTIAAVQPTGMSQTEWAQFLCSIDESQIIQLASSKSDYLNPEHHLQVMSRAALLLRVATGASDSLFRAAGLDRTTLTFWTNQFGQTRGLWQGHTKPENMLDLWIDVQGALTALKKWSSTNQGSDLFTLRHDPVLAVNTLCECERVALWGMGQ